ncbi:MAG TPA: DNA polymerase III subunit delta, partial [Thermopolyspora sp.]
MLLGVMANRAVSEPAPVTLVVGDEELLADRAVSSIVAAVRAADPGAEVHDLVGSKVEPGEVTRLTSPSLFGDRSVTVIRAAHDLAKDVIAEVVRYAARPADDAVLVLAHPGGVKGKALVEGVKKAGAFVVTVAKVTKPGERLDFIRAEAKRAGRAITPGAAQALLDAVGNDLRELASACGQLAFDTPADEKTINEAAVARYHRGQAAVSGFTVAESAAEGRLAEALEQLRWSLATGTAPVLIVSALAKELRTLAKVAGARDLRGQKLAQRLGMPPWLADRYQKRLRAWGPAGLSAAIQAVADADEQVKGGGTDPAYALERTVQIVCSSR